MCACGHRKLLRWLLAAQLATYGDSAATRSHSPADWARPAALWRKWGTPYSWAAGASADSGAPAATAPPGLHPTWHIPSTEERASALALVNEFLVAPMLRLRAFAAAHGGAPTSASAPAPAVMSPADVKTASEALVKDLKTTMAALRGCVVALTDGATFEGDDVIICNGSRGNALVFDAAARSAFFAEGSGSASRSSLRHEVVDAVHGVARALAAHADFSREVKALTVTIKLAYRSICSRGMRTSAWPSNRMASSRSSVVSASSASAAISSPVAGRARPCCTSVSSAELTSKRLRCTARATPATSVRPSSRLATSAVKSSGARSAACASATNRSWSVPTTVRMRA